MIRLRTLLIVIAAVAVSVWLWQRADMHQVVSPASSVSETSPIASPAAAPRAAFPPSSAAHDQPPIASSAAGNTEAATNSAAPARAAPGVAVRLEVNAPASAR